ncbi:hypothetical protein BOX15_Mlig002708g1 [Macrostomum lignano]|uniref:N-terminal Ras-GEF domain-containing protein n=1 Tax=Macrostomum lignano TaxID=282301 RepID=A0A267FA68_9PLAT|nr:hypothetical protein BOX15_Mlig002708g1 [Macrostomum lignano]
MSLSASSRSKFYVDLEDSPPTEIVEEGYAVYTMKMKKQFVSATGSLHRQLEQPPEDRACIFMAGSLEAIVEGLAPPDHLEDKVDCLHMNILLTTYPAFASTEELLQIVFDKLRNGSSRVNSERLRAALLVTLNAWLAEPFQELLRLPPEFRELRLLAEGCEAAAAAAETSETAGRLDLLARLARRRLETFGAAAAAEASTAEAEAAGCGGQGGRRHWRRVEWDEIDDLQVAEQLTRLDARLFESVRLHECLGSQWGRHRRSGCSPSVDATVQQFNRVCSLVASQALQPGLQPEDRAQLLNRWIHIAQYLRRGAASPPCAPSSAR